MTAAAYSIQIADPLAASRSSAAAPSPAPSDGKHLFSFGDFLDIINPLQHLPVVSTIYRKLTHDEIGTPEKIMGDTLFGGIPGLISSVADTAFEKITGKNFADTALSLFDRGDDQPKFASDEIASPDTTLASVTPTLAYDDSSATLAATKPMSEEETTASLNRAQIKLAQLARATTAYARADDLTTAKQTDLAAAAY